MPPGEADPQPERSSMQGERPVQDAEERRGRASGAWAGLPTIARLGRMLGGQLPAPGQRIGLLGGSFNPAHEGHLAISEEALRRLHLDQIWWLVSPQNPLKSSSGMAPQEQRAARAAAMIRNPRIRVTMLESALGTVYTAESLKLLAERFPKSRFVWLMGADNLVQIEHWQDWTKIFNTMAIAVFDRPTYSLRALAAKAARRFARYRRREGDAKRIADRTPPAWVFLHNRLNAQSSTAMRAAEERVGKPVRSATGVSDNGKD